MHLTLVGSQLNGKLVLVIAQRQVAAIRQGFLQNHTSVELIAYAHLLSEQLQSAENGLLSIVYVSHQLGIDDVHTTQTTYQNQTILSLADRALVVGSVLQTVLATEATNGKAPFAIFLFMGHHVRHAMLSNYPHIVLVILCDTYHTRTKESIVHIEHRLLTRLLVHDTATSCRTMPDESSAVFYHTDRRGHR